MSRATAVLALAVAYFAAARVGLLLASLHGSVSPVWPATGVAIGGLLVGGVRLWPAVAIGALVANATTGASLAASAGIALGNTLEALVGTALVQLCERQRTRLGAFTEVVGFSLAASVAPLSSAGVGVLSLLASGAIAAGSARELGFTWWVGDALGAFLVAPLALASRGTGVPWRAFGWWSSARAALLIGVALVASWLIFYRPAGGGFLLALFPILLLATAWFDALGVRLVACLFAAISIEAASRGSGPFTGGTLNDDLLRLQLFMTSVAAAALILPLFRRMGDLPLPTAVLLVGWGVSGWLFSSLYEGRLAQSETRLRTAIAHQQGALGAAMDRYEDVLRGAAGFVQASRDVEPSEWTRYVSSLRLSDHFPELGAIGLVVERPSTGGPSRPWLRYIEPPLPAHEMVPLAPALADAIVRREPGVRLTARAPPLTLGAKTFERWLWLEIEGTPPAGLGAGPSAWVCAPFDVEAWVARAMRDSGGGLSLRLFEGDSAAPGHLVFESRPFEPVSNERSSRLELGGRSWTLAWHASPSLSAQDLSAPLLAATGSALVTLLLAGLVMSLHGFGKRATALAAVRTQQLDDALRLQRAVLDGTLLGIIATDRGGVIREFNAGAETMLGYQRDEVVGRETPLLLVDGAELEARAAALGPELGRVAPRGFGDVAARAERGEVDELEWALVRKDGSRLPVLATITALRSEGGAITGYLGIARDMTEAKRIALALSESEQRTRLFAEHAPAAVAMFDREMRYLVASKRWIEDYGLVGRDIIGVSHYDAFPEIPAHWKALHQRCLAGETLTNDADPFERVGGRRQWLSWRIQPWYTPAGDVGGIVMFTADITERVAASQALAESEAALLESEARWKFALEGSGHGVWDWDIERGALSFSKQWRTLFGYAEAQSTSDRWQDLIHPDDLGGAMAALERQLRQDESSSYQDEYRLLLADGSQRWVSARGKVWLRQTDGRALRMLGTHTDITARKQLERTLAEARDQALEASRLKSEFLANMSHEIRTPMNGVLGMTALLLDTALSSEQREMGRLIRGSAEALLVVIDDILDLSKIEAGKLSVTLEEFDPNALFNDALLPHAPQARTKGIELRLDMGDVRLPRLCGDPVRIRQVLTNFVGNAIKFTEAGEVSVRVRAETAERGVKLHVAVRDTGIGIPKDVQERLFQPFTQASSGTTRRFGGTGLGLAISRRLIELMGGAVGLESTPGQGSVFWFELPLNEAAERAPPSLDRPAASAPAARAPGPPRALSILIAEDNRTNQIVAARLLGKLGHRSDIAVNGREALSMLARSKYDAVLMDCQMPELDGYTAARKIRAGEIAGVDPHLPIIALTAHAMADDREKCISAGMDDYVSKPLSMHDLADALARLGAGPTPSGGLTGGEAQEAL